jgi:hypothetical protein
MPPNLSNICWRMPPPIGSWQSEPTPDLELAGYPRERASEIGADSAQDRYGCYRHQRGNQAVLERRGAVLVLQKSHECREHSFTRLLRDNSRRTLRNH